MPIANVYATRDLLPRLSENLTALADKIADELTTQELLLDRDHISIRLIELVGRPIGDVEIELIAHCFPSRVQRQDAICTEIRLFLESQLSRQVRVWLVLAETGYGYINMIKSDR